MLELRIYLIKNHISIKDFAERIKYSRSQISNILNGASKPSKRLMITIEQATNGEVKAEDLLKGE